MPRLKRSENVSQYFSTVTQDDFYDYLMTPIDLTDPVTPKLQDVIQAHTGGAEPKQVIDSLEEVLALVGTLP